MLANVSGVSSRNCGGANSPVPESISTGVFESIDVHDNPGAGRVTHAQHLAMQVALGGEPSMHGCQVLTVRRFLSFADVVKQDSVFWPAVRVSAKFEEIDQKINENAEKIEKLHELSREAKEKALDGNTEKDVHRAIEDVKQFESQAQDLRLEVEKLRKQYQPDPNLSEKDKAAQEKVINEGIEKIDALTNQVTGLRKDAEYDAPFAFEQPEKRSFKNVTLDGNTKKKVQLQRLLPEFQYKPEVLDRRRSSLKAISDALVAESYEIKKSFDARPKRERLSPCYSVVFSTHTGKYYHAENIKFGGDDKKRTAFIEELHPLIKARIEEYQSRSSACNLDPKAIGPEQPGNHSEVRAVSQALADLPDGVDVNDPETLRGLHIFNMRTRVGAGKKPERNGDSMRRCNNCKVLTRGVNSISDVEGYINQLPSYIAEYKKRHNDESPPLQMISEITETAKSPVNSTALNGANAVDYEALGYDPLLGLTREDGQAFSGRAVVSDDEGVSTLNIVQGALEGPAEIRNSNGNKREVINYQAGVPHGERTRWFASGSQALTETYGYGVLLDSTTYDENGNILDQYQIDPSSEDYKIYSQWRAMDKISQS